MKSKTLFVSAKESHCGTLTIALGLMELLKSRYGKVAFFKPLIKEKEDSDIELIIKHFKLKEFHDEAYALTLEEATQILSEGDETLFYEKIIEKFKLLEKKYDFVLCEGISQKYIESLFDYDINLQIAKNLSTPFVGVIKAKDKDIQMLEEEIKLWVNMLRSENTPPFAIFLNRADKLSKEDIKRIENLYDIPSFVIPEKEELAKPSVMEVASFIKADYLNESLKEKLFLRTVMHYKVAAMRIEHFLQHLQEGDLIITPGDRSDILLAALGSNAAKNLPSVAGILLTGGLQPEESVKKLLKGMDYSQVPIIMSKYDTYCAALKAAETPSSINVKNRRKIALAIGLFLDNTDTKMLESRIKCVSSFIMTPAMFEYLIFEKARSRTMRIVLPEVFDDRILSAAEIILNRNLANVVLLGKREDVLHRAEVIGVNIKKAMFIDPGDEELKERFAKKFYSMRLCKGITYEKAMDAIEDPTYFATMLVNEGIVDGMVSGATHTTRETIKPALEIIKTKKGVSLVSSVFFMCLDTKVLVYADCAVNPDPTAEELAQIAISSADTAKEFGIDPIVAMLSYSSGDSGVGVDVEKVREATKIAKKMRKDILIDGPLQYDAAIDMKVAKQKMPHSRVAGRANVFIFPDLNTGNNTYKAVQRATGAIAVGPVLQGLKKPVNDLSRGCGIDDIVSTVAITAIQAQERDAHLSKGVSRSTV